MTTITGIYKDGIVELSELPAEITQAPVLVTFLEQQEIDLQSLGISQEQAAELRTTFATFEDWNNPEMDIYNNYDASKSALNPTA
ncbi:MAG: hypothetical protein JNK38_13670 [Acidobacteria bacterium]|nr:hypothetical protein [Acidobacteriota bacterium]